MTTAKTELTNSDKIHLALSPWNLSDDYNRHAGATLLSLLENSSMPVIVHLLYDSNESIGNEDGELYNRECYQKISDIYGCEIQYHHVEMPHWIVEEIPAVKRWTPGSLMRLYLPEILKDVEKVLYLDCDIIVNLDVKELWETDLETFHIGAVIPDRKKTLSLSRKRKQKRRDFEDKFNINKDNYFNAGVLLMDLKSIRQKKINFTEELLNLLRINPELPYLDQDLLNIWCKGEFVHLPKKYNIFATNNHALEYAKDAIIHYTVQEIKPWKRYVSGIDDYYWDYVVKTPWFDNRKKMLTYVRAAPDIERCLDILPENILINSGIGYLNKIKKISTTLIKLNKSTLIKGWKKLFPKY